MMLQLFLLKGMITESTFGICVMCKDEAMDLLKTC